MALDNGPDFARHAAIGSLAGTAAQAGFCVAYARTSRWFGWPIALTAATVAYGLGAIVFEITDAPLALLLPVVVAALTVARALVPRPRIQSAMAPVMPHWDIPARMCIAAVLVVGLSTAALLIGAPLAGLLATYPVFATVLAVFAHHREGDGAARQVLRGLLFGLFGFAGFFSILAFMLPIGGGTAAAFLCATLAALLIQGCSLWLIRRGGAPRCGR